MSDYKPTAEQQWIEAAVKAAKSGDIVVVRARAGTGKTTTARQIARALSGKKILYMAFNKSTQTEAEKSFPSNVSARTSHSLAWGFGKLYRNRMPKPMGTAPRVRMSDAARQLGVSDVEIGEHRLAADRVLRIALNAVARFARSADSEVTACHVSLQQGMEREHRALCEVIVPVARRAWEDIKSGSALNVQGEHYIKMWQLSRPTLKYDVIIYDEAQDANGAVAAVIESQPHAVVIAIGDDAQAINGWNGAVDFLSRVKATADLPLSQSFRFGQAIADAGNKWLGLLGVPEATMVKGYDRINSVVEHLDDPDAVLCRTNGGCVAVAIRYLSAGKKVAIVGGGQAFKELAQAALQLQSGGRAYHPDLAAFKSWEEVEAYAKEDEGADLRPFVKIINQVGAAEVIRCMESLAGEGYADVTVSTMHKSKGREWKRVQIHTDCPEPEKAGGVYTGTVSREQAMLYYVASTRAIEVLDDEGFSWINDYLAQS